MRKTILLSLSGLLIVCSTLSAQEKKQKKDMGIMPYTEVLYGLGLCGESNAFSFIGGIEKPVAKHWAVSADIHYWKSDYENYCCDVYSKGTYSSIIPSVKMKFDPGKRNKGVFIGVGLGYVFARDRGTEQPYSYDPSTGIKIMGKDITNTNWDFNSIAPSFNWGVSFKIARFPVSLINTNYFAKLPWYGGLNPITTGVGMRVGFRKVGSKCSEVKKKCERSGKGCGSRR